MFGGESKVTSRAQEPLYLRVHFQKAGENRAADTHSPESARNLFIVKSVKSIYV